MKRKIVLTLACFTSLFYGCEQQPLTAHEVIKKAMTAHGSALLRHSETRFNFRDTQYAVLRDGGNMQYTRTFIQEADTVKDVKTNSSMTRYRNGQVEVVSDSLRKRHDAALNSVVYFAQLPYSLDGPAVIKKHLGMDTIKGEGYHQIEVSFKEEGGGEDHEDVFMYWVNAQTFLVDYLAYSFCEEACGYRFRESVNRTNQHGVVIQDYKNYKAGLKEVQLQQLDNLFEQGKLELLSEIVNDDVTIRLLNSNK